jgi:hypothetical protein
VQYAAEDAAEDAAEEAAGGGEEVAEEVAEVEDKRRTGAERGAWRMGAWRSARREELQEGR